MKIWMDDLENFVSRQNLSTNQANLSHLRFVCYIETKTKEVIVWQEIDQLREYLRYNKIIIKNASTNKQRPEKNGLFL